MFYWPHYNIISFENKLHAILVRINAEYFKYTRRYYNAPAISAAKELLFKHIFDLCIVFVIIKVPCNGFIKYYIKIRFLSLH